MSKLTNNELLAILEIENVLQLYVNQDVESIGNLLEISHDLPIGNLEYDTKSLISIILEQNSISDKQDIINKSKILTEIGLGTLKKLARHTKNVIKSTYKIGKTVTGAGVVGGVAAASIHSNYDDNEPMPKLNPEPKQDPPEDNSFMSKVRKHVQNAWEVTKNSKIGKTIASHPYASAAIGIGAAGLGYAAYKKHKGDKEKAIKELELKKTDCQTDECKTSYDIEIDKLKNKG